ncbi:RagB/SusD family nutrient uptake outer membrane protein [Mucilaginibacter mallensis]|nr:RagB/SusD family nutrient uptake outer membrane protein [Mucilaginibacter mallensis]
MISILSLYSCKKDSFLTRYPVSSLTQESFFNNATDLNTYANGFYSYVPGITSVALNDQQSDNYDSNPFNKVVAGQLILPITASSAGWTWTYLTDVNYFLQNYQKANASQAIKNHYVGVARFFRAWFYFDKVKQFGAVPWYGSTINPADNADLYKARDSRQLVMDSVMADLKFAVNNINPTGPSGTITKWVALALMARVGLHEGTFRQYQGITGGQPFLKTADSAALAIMQSGNFKLYTTNHPTQDYQNLFLFYNPTDAQATSEVILGSYYSSTLHNFTALDGYMTGYGLGLTKGLMNSYLMTDGTPFTAVPGHDTMMIKGEFNNRDPRMMQTVLQATATDGNLKGTKTLGNAPTGYLQIKYYDPATPGWNSNYNAGINFRYGEMLLIYAETKAELANAGVGTFTQADLDMTINLLRDRVGMPHLMMNVPIDPVLAASYPNVSGSLQNVLLEIRRERRVELACEGFRYDDLMRWKSGPLLAQQFTGMYFPALGTYDLNGDGVADIALVTSAPANPVATVSYFVVGTDIYLSHGTYGNVVVNPTLVKTFTDPKNYLFPLPTQELQLNPKLTQNPGW